LTILANLNVEILSALKTQFALGRNLLILKLTNFKIDGQA